MPVRFDLGSGGYRHTFQFTNYSDFLDTFALFGSIAWQLANGRITGMNADGSFTTT